MIMSGNAVQAAMIWQRRDSPHCGLLLNQRVDYHIRLKSHPSKTGYLTPNMSSNSWRMQTEVPLKRLDDRNVFHDVIFGVTARPKMLDRFLNNRHGSLRKIDRTS
jgi:hypothetical protein